MPVRKFIAVFIITDVVLLAGALLFFSKNGVISSQFSYISSVLIMLASFFSFYRKSKNIDAEEFDLDEVEKKRGMRLRKIVLGNSIFFSMYRVFAYVFFILGFFVLLRHNLFDTVGFFSGVVCSSLAIVFIFLLSSYAKTNTPQTSDQES